MKNPTKKLILFSAALLIGGTAQAANIACTGNYLGYNFNVNTRSSGSRVAGKINVLISKSGGETVKQGILRATSSDIRKGQYIRFAGSSSDGSGTVNASYDAGSRLYTGTLVANSQATGTVNVNVSCSMSGSRDLDEEIEAQPFFDVVIPEMLRAQ